MYAGPSKAEATAEFRDHVSRAQAMTRLMVQTHEDNIHSKLNEEREARTKAIDEMHQKIKAVESNNLDKGAIDALRHDLSEQTQLLRELSEAFLRFQRELDLLRGDLDRLKATTPASSVKGDRSGTLAGNVKGGRSGTPTSSVKGSSRSNAGKAGVRPDQSSPKIAQVELSLTREIAELNVRVERSRKELQEQINELRVLVEHSAVRAGFLAIAASECQPDEKAWLFTKLKAREDALAVTQGGNAGEANDQVDAIEAPKGSSYQEFFVEVDRSTGMPLGLTVDGSNGKTLLVESVAEEECLVSGWNRANPNKAIRAGDRISAVNGQSGSASVLFQEMGKCRGKLSLTVCPRTPEGAGVFDFITPM